MRKYAFFAHFNRIAMQRGESRVWTVHYRGACMPASEIVFRVPCKTRFAPDGRQPRATIRGYATKVYNDGSAVVIT